jgi:serine/threonine protein kinase
MGEVYRARDTRLGRDVAVKILSPDTSASLEARQRFQREARTISQLSHPNICALYDVGEAPSPESPIPQPYLVMELLEGETLAQRLLAGALPLEQILRCGKQIADALAKAHRAGVVHRDLKPANVMLTKGGLKLLDFGLAKAASPPGSTAFTVATVTAPRPITARGVIAGTVQYMAPEQIEGRSADARSDIYAFGAVMYEMATGTRAFGSVPRPLAPKALDRVVCGCLAPDPDERWQSAHDILLQLAAIDHAPTHAKTDRDHRFVWLHWVVSAAAVAFAAMLWLKPVRTVNSPPQTVRLTIPPPQGGSFYQFFETVGLSVSPDGTRIAFTGRGAAGPRRVWLRDITELDARPLAGTHGATSLFWSPDGRSLAFFSGSKLRRVDMPDGTPVSICDVREGVGFAGTWGADGHILFSSVEGEAIYRVAANGGTAAAILKAESARHEARLNWPFFLPDGKRFLYLRGQPDGSGHLMFVDVDKAPRDVMPVQSGVQYVEPGYLVFVQERVLLGRRFDPQRGVVIGAPFSIADPINYFLTTTAARFAVSPNGTLVYQSFDDELRLLWFDRGGREEGTIGEAGQLKGPRLSPDESRVVFDRMQAGAYDVWETDLARQIETRLTFGVSSEGAGPWAPDGRSLFFNADLGAPPQIFRKNFATGADTLVVPASGTLQEPQDVSPDGRSLLFTQRGVGGNHIWILTLDGSRAPTRALATSVDQDGARFSRDGRYFSYDSRPTGRGEVYVSPFPPTGETVTVSSNGGSGGRWSRDGRELFYLSADSRLMSVAVQTSPSLRVGTPVPVFRIDPNHSWSDYDVSSTGRFLSVVSEKRSAEQPLTVVVNWRMAPGHRDQP